MAGILTSFLLAGILLTAAGCASPEGALHEDAGRAVNDMSTLLTKARQSGSVRVIVRLRVPEAPVHAAKDREGTPAASDDRTTDLEQRSVVAESVLAGLSGTRYRVYRRYTALPLIALEASPETLEALSAMPDVEDIREDSARPLE